MASELLLEELEKHSIRVYNGMEVKWPQIDCVSRLDTRKIGVIKLEGYYNVERYMVAFCHRENMYVTGYTHMVTDILKKAGFKENYFEFPFCHGEYPVKEQQGFFKIKKEAELERKKEFEDNCKKFSEVIPIKPISNETLETCMEIPPEGIEVDLVSYRVTYYPNVTGCATIHNVGKYCTNNGCTVFVNFDGRTFVTKKNIVKELDEKGYRKENFRVPFSNGETILNENVRKKWQEL